MPDGELASPWPERPADEVGKSGQALRADVTIALEPNDA
jgi:hypothetical protein